MAKNFDDLSADVQATWDDDTRRVHAAASEIFESEMALRAQLGRELAAARDARKLTQPQLQAASGVQQAEISRIERGVGNPTFATIAKIMRALDANFSIARN